MGIAPLDEAADAAIVTALFGFLHDSQAPFEQVFFDWRGGRLSDARAAASPIAALYATESFGGFAVLLRDYSPAAGVSLAHPYFAKRTPRTMLIDEMEALWAPIAAADDWTAFHAALGEIAALRDAYSAAF